MMKIGILGSDSSHAVAFSKLCNIPDPQTQQYNFPGIRITAIYGQDKEQTEKVALEGKIPTIAVAPEELLGKVDAVMVVFRDGGTHASYALPFIEAGVPVWIDKPFTVSLEDAKRLIRAAEKNNVLLTGGSTCKYSQDILKLQQIVKNGEVGTVVSGYMNFPGDINSPYHGIFFYGPHMVEMLFTIFGYNVKSVISTKNANEIICVANYETFSVVLNFNNHAAQSHCIIHGDKKSTLQEINIGVHTYKLGFEKFAEMLETGQRPIALDKLAAPTILLDAINKSLVSGKEIYMNEYDG